jgi:hypothetical protein
MLDRHGPCVFMMQMESESPAQSEALGRERLRALVVSHEAVFEVHHSQVPSGRGARTIGYDVFLIGRHSTPMLRPGCNKCQAIWIDLAAVARSALPSPGGKTRVSIRPFDHSLHIASATDGPEVELVIEVRHRSDYAGALDACEDECLSRLVANLRALGVSTRGEPPKPRR